MNSYSRDSYNSGAARHDFRGVPERRGVQAMAVIRNRRLVGTVVAVVVFLGAPAVHAAECGKGEWVQLPDMSVPRLYPGLVVLPDGNVMALGGGSTFSQSKYYLTWNSTASTEVFDFNSWTWVPGPDLNQPTGDMDTVWLNDGRLFLVAGVPSFTASMGTCDPAPSVGMVDTLFYDAATNLLGVGPPLSEGGGESATTLRSSSLRSTRAPARADPEGVQVNSRWCNHRIGVVSVVGAPGRR